MKKIPGLMLAMLVGAALCTPALAQIPPPPPASPASSAAPAPMAPAAAGALPAPAPAAPAPPVAASVTPLPAPVPPPALPPQAKPPRPPKPAKPPEAPEAATPPPPEPARAPEAPRERVEAEPVNVRFEVTVSSQTGTGAPVRRSAVVTVSNGAMPGQTGSGMLRSGNSIPVANTTLTTKGEDGKDAPAARPLTSYSWRSVGLNVDATYVTVLPGNRVRATLNIEFSGVDEKAPGQGGAPPSFPTFSQRLNLYLDSGKPLMVAQSSDFVDNVERKQTVEVKATILR